MFLSYFPGKPRNMRESFLSTDQLSIMVTAIGGGGHGEQILKALRLAKGDRYRIIGADANPDCPQFAWVDERVQLPLASNPEYIGALLHACDRFGVKALFHGCEPELKQMSTHREEIEGRGILLPINSAAVIDTCMNKEATNRRLAALGFDAPRYLRASSRDDLTKVNWFPVVVKPAVGGGGPA